MHSSSVARHLHQAAIENVRLGMPRRALRTMALQARRRDRMLAPRTRKPRGRSVRGHYFRTRGLLNHSHLQEAVTTLESFRGHAVFVAWELPGASKRAAVAARRTRTIEDWFAVNERPSRGHQLRSHDLSSPPQARIRTWLACHRHRTVAAAFEKEPPCALHR